MTVEVAQSSRSQPVSTGVVATVLRSFVEIGAAIKALFPTSHRAAAGRCEESAGVEAETVATVQIIAHTEVEVDAGISPVLHEEPDQQEIERRRSLVRTLFNDFWSGAHDKPAAFVERLDQAESYLNERLTANGELWRLDAKTRVALGLPARSSSPD